MEINGKYQNGDLRNLCVERKKFNSKEVSEVAEFYKGKTIFITGAAGFLGTVLLETLLRCCTGIQRIYILLRSKKGVTPEKRKESIFNKEIFHKIKESDPNALEKVVVIAGDVTEENLGMSESDFERVVDEVAIVFHCAAIVSFFKPLITAIGQNVIGTSTVIDLCRKLKKLEAFVYTSTAFSNGNQQGAIEDKVYKLPFAAEEIEKLVRQKDAKELDRLYSTLDPPPLNTYVFSKSVAENLITEKASDLPVSIVRPSVISCCMKGSMPGYIEDGSALILLCRSVGRGYIHVIMVDDENISQQIPADVAANTLILSAYLQATKNLPSPYVYNCTSGDLINWTSEDYTRALLKISQEYLLPNTYTTPWLVTCKNSFTYTFFTILMHYLPAAIIDLILWICGRKPRFIKQYKFYDRCIKTTLPFWTECWEFSIDHFKSLPNYLNEADSETFSVDLKDFTLEALTRNITTGCPLYRVNNKLYRENQKITLVRKTVEFLLKWCLLGIIAVWIYRTVV